MIGRVEGGKDEERERESLRREVQLKSEGNRGEQ